MSTITNTVLIMDDEPHILDWLVEYLESKGCVVEFATNVGEAIDLLRVNKYRIAILDLNVPAPGEYSKLLADEGEPYVTYRGLFVAKFARNHGHRGRQVVVYSVHDSDEVSRVCKRIDISYLVKGRPRSFKRELDDILSYDPTEDD